MTARPAAPSETDALARLWYDGWQDAHATILPPALARARTRQSFAERMAAALADVRVIGPQGAPLGFAMLKGDELCQFYVASEARGAGIAGALMADAEAQLSARGVETVWLACAIGNEKSGWYLAQNGGQPPRHGRWSLRSRSLALREASGAPVKGAAILACSMIMDFRT